MLWNQLENAMLREMGLLLWLVAAGCSGTEPPQDVPEKPVVLAVDGFEGAFQVFISEPNAKQAQSVGGVDDVSALLDADQNDTTLFKHAVASYELHVRSPVVLRRLDAIRTEYLQVLTALREADLPDVFAAIPYLESRYHAKATSRTCHGGYWQFGPEAGVRAKRAHQMDFTVAKCPVVHGEQPPVAWTATEPVPGPDGADCETVSYLGKDKDGKCFCRIKNTSHNGKGVCDEDDRIDLTKATTLAIRELRLAFDDKELAASGAAVQLAILSHHLGYDAKAYGAETRPTNIKPSYANWRNRQPEAKPHHFYGANLNCRKSDDPAECALKSVITPPGQHYGYPIIAQHMAAACYYGLNYASESPIFQEYADRFTGEKGYCMALRIKTPAELKETGGPETD